jgi:hypothetical protein
MNLSNKPVIPPPKEAYFRFPKRMADDVDPITGKHCMTISINKMKRLIPVEEPVHLSQEEFELLSNIGEHLPPNREYDPIRKH